MSQLYENLSFEENTLQFNNVNVATAGTYRLVVQYANGELGAGAAN